MLLAFRASFESTRTSRRVPLDIYKSRSTRKRATRHRSKTKTTIDEYDGEKEKKKERISRENVIVRARSNTMEFSLTGPFNDGNERRATGFDTQPDARVGRRLCYVATLGTR